MDDRIIQMAKANSYNMIDRKFHEEIGELMVAKAKLDTAFEANSETTDELILCRHNAEELKYELAGEIADVQIMMKQLTYVLGIEYTVEQRTEEKIQRQLERNKRKEQSHGISK